jgi:hypothetical protein
MKINGHRVEVFRYIPNSVDKCNLRLQQTAHLAWCVLESFGIAVPDFCISPNGVIDLDKRIIECVPYTFADKSRNRWSDIMK